MITGDIEDDGEIDVVVLYGAPAVIHRLDSNLVPVTSFQTFRTVETFEIAALPYPRRNLLLAQAGGEPLVIGIDSVTGDEVWRSPILLREIVNDGIRQFYDPEFGAAPLSIATSGGTCVTQ